jgi:hypothetical protein
MALCCSNDSSYLDADLERCISSLRELQDSLRAETHRHAAPVLEEGGDMFNNLKSQIVGRLCTVRTLLEVRRAKRRRAKRAAERAVLEDYNHGRSD